MKLIRSILLISALFVLGACSKDDIETPQEEQREWYQLVRTDTLICSEGFPVQLDTRIVRATFMYRTQMDSLSVSLSGCVCWPLGCTENDEIWLENHYTTSRWNECPTHTVQPGMPICHFRKAIYVSSDYIGMGLTKDTEPMMFFDTPFLARQSVDCFKAALTVLKDNGIAIASDYRTYTYGHSLGGGVSLAIARLAELEPETKKLLHLKKAFCSAGPYDQVVMISSLINNAQKEMEMPAIIPLDVESAINSNSALRNKYKLEDFLSSAMIDAGIMEMIRSKQYDTSEIGRRMKANGIRTLKDCVNPTLLDTTSAIYRDFIDVHKAYDLTDGWEPSIPILFYHDRNDGVVSYDCMESFRKKHPGNPLISYEDNYMNHVSCGTQFYMSIYFNSNWLN